MADSSPKKWFKLEESFFHAVDEKLLENLRRQSATEERAASIQRVAGLDNPALAREIAALDISVESLTALRLIPLVAVAWADERVDDTERFRVLKAAEKAGIVEGDPAYDLLKLWLARRPSHELLDTWIEYARSLAMSLDGESRKNLHKTVLDQVRSVAEASGGLLGFAAISPSEKAVIERIDAALA
jgi:hypothetical protein